MWQHLRQTVNSYPSFNQCPPNPQAPTPAILGPLHSASGTLDSSFAGLSQIPSDSSVEAFGHCDPLFSGVGLVQQSRVRTRLSLGDLELCSRLGSRLFFEQKVEVKMQRGSICSRGNSISHQTREKYEPGFS